MILKIFSPKKLRKNGVFVDLFKIPLFFAKKSIITLVFQKKRQYSRQNGRKSPKLGENGRKSPKIVVIT
jgi:hypothetical protein